MIPLPRKNSREPKNLGSLISGRAQAQDLVSAKLLSIEGRVEIRRRPGDQVSVQKIAFKIEDELRAGDTIITGKNVRLTLGLSDGSQAVIAPKTTVVIKTWGDRLAASSV